MSVYQDLTVVRDAITILHNEWLKFRRDGLFVAPIDVQNFVYLTECLATKLNHVADHLEHKTIPFDDADNIIVFPFHKHATEKSPR